MKKKKQLRNQSGFTLVEVIVVAVIVAILAGVSIPLYGGYVENSRANQAANVAGSVASFMGACYQNPNAIPVIGDGADEWEDGDVTPQVDDDDDPAILTCRLSATSERNPRIQIPRGFVVNRNGDNITGRYHEVAETATEGVSSPYAFSGRDGDDDAPPPPPN